ncbi:MAG: hypothetical protein HZA27_04105, partial [Candidatus Omnitrophica bacterium]|nr:hypothetical protein [Candidatus Omnitrophota bacterium]
KYIIDNSLLITPGDREDMLTSVLGCVRDSDKKKLKLSGIILSGGIMPEQPVLDLLSQAKIPILLAKADTYTVASIIHDLTVKIRPQDKEKIKDAIKLAKENIDLNSILKGI